VAGAATAVVAVVAQADGAASVESDQLVLDEADAEIDGGMEMDELVLEEFETDGAGSDEVLEMDIVADEPIDDLIEDVEPEAADAATGSESASQGASAAAAAEAGDVMATEPPAMESAMESDTQPAMQSAEQADGDGLMGHDWVLSRDPAHYTIQLLGSWKRADALAFVRANPLPGVGALVQTRRRGKPWFSLYYGDFSSYSKAVAEQSALKGGIAKHGPWVRPYRKIQSGLK